MSFNKDIIPFGYKSVCFGFRNIGPHRVFTRDSILLSFKKMYGGPIVATCAGSKHKRKRWFDSATSIPIEHTRGHPPLDLLIITAKCIPGR